MMRDIQRPTSPDASATLNIRPRKFCASSLNLANDDTAPTALCARLMIESTRITPRLLWMSLPVLLMLLRLLLAESAAGPIRPSADSACLTAAKRLALLPVILTDTVATICSLLD